MITIYTSSENRFIIPDTAGDADVDVDAHSVALSSALSSASSSASPSSVSFFSVTRPPSPIVIVYGSRQVGQAELFLSSSSWN
jgi:hypothetical protein